MLYLWDFLITFQCSGDCGTKVNPLLYFIFLPIYSSLLFGDWERYVCTSLIFLPTFFRSQISFDICTETRYWSETIIHNSPVMSIFRNLTEFWFEFILNEELLYINSCNCQPVKDALLSLQQITNQIRRRKIIRPSPRIAHFQSRTTPWLTGVRDPKRWHNSVKSMSCYFKTKGNFFNLGYQTSFFAPCSRVS